MSRLRCVLIFSQRTPSPYSACPYVFKDRYSTLQFPHCTMHSLDRSVRLISLRKTSVFIVRAVRHINIACVQNVKYDCARNLVYYKVTTSTRSVTQTH